MPDTILNVIKERRSIRKYQPEQVPNEIINLVAEAARWAPSPTNKQSFELLVIRSPEIKTAMAEAIKQELTSIERELPHEDAVSALQKYGMYFTFFETAPLVIVITYRMKPSVISVLKGGKTDTTQEVAVLFSIGAAIQNMLLTLHDLGYGACWMTGPLIAEKNLANVLGIEHSMHIAAIIPIGKPAEQPVPPKRREIDKIIRMWNK